MGTNYYWIESPKACPTCGHDPSDVIHIGKKSIGWRFSFHGTDEMKTWHDWRAKIESGDGIIQDEYGEKISVSDFCKLVESSQGKSHHRYCKEHHPEYAKSTWEDSDGYSFSPGEWS